MAKISTADFIAAIKEMSVLELNELVKAIEEEFGVSAAAPVAVMGAAAPAEEAAPSEVSVILKSAGAAKLGVAEEINERIENLKMADKLTNSGFNWGEYENFANDVDLDEDFELDKRDYTTINVSRDMDGNFVVSGGKIDELIRGIVLSDTQSFAYFQKRLKNDGVIDMLKEKGAKEGDIIKIKDIVFEMVD